ncbi:MAG: ArdC-like ssDNA-binding domain-containing protein [Phycisphaerae bacterium]
MKTEQIRKMGEDTIARLASELEAQPSVALQQYLRAMARFRQYSVHNMLLILSQYPGATRVAGFHAWQKMGRHIKAGAKGLAILAPMVMRQKRVVVQGPDEDDVIVKAEEVVRYKPVYVWDLSMTEGKPLSEPPRVQGDPGQYLPKLEEYVARLGIKLEYGPTMEAEGYTTGDRIVLKLALSPAATFAVLTHELAHVRLGHCGSELSRMQREAEAEGCAAVVAEVIGLDVGTASADYLKHYRVTKETLLASLMRIRDVALEIIDAILEKPEETKQNMTATTVPEAAALAA